MHFAARDLPAGLILDSETGCLTGTLAIPGEHRVLVQATNTRGSAERTLRIVIGEQIAGALDRARSKSSFTRFPL